MVVCGSVCSLRAFRVRHIVRVYTLYVYAHALRTFDAYAAAAAAAVRHTVDSPDKALMPFAREYVSNKFIQRQLSSYASPLPIRPATGFNL